MANILPENRRVFFRYDFQLSWKKLGLVIFISGLTEAKAQIPSDVDVEFELGSNFH